MVSFCLAGVVVRATFGFFLLVFLFLLADSGGMALWVLTGCLLHEGGHLLAMLAMRVPVRRLELTAAGIHIRRGRESLSPGRELLVLAAGPGINLLTALVLFLLGWLECSAANCALGLFHLLPARGLDGGSILEICCRRFWGMERGEQVSKGISWMLWLGVLAMLGREVVKEGLGTQTVLLGVLALALLPVRK